MLGKRSAQRDQFEVGNVIRLELDPHGFHGQLGSAAGSVRQAPEVESESAAGHRQTTATSRPLGCP